MVALPCCVSFHCRAKGSSHPHTYIPSPLHFSPIPVTTEHPHPLCSQERPHQPPVSDIVSMVCMCQSQPPFASHSLLPHWGPYMCSLCLRLYICFANKTIYTTFLGEGNGTPLQHSCLENPMDGGAWWATVHRVAKSQTRLCDFTFTFHFHALEKDMATHSSVLACRIPGTGEPGGLPSMRSHGVRHD